MYIQYKHKNKMFKDFTIFFMMTNLYAKNPFDFMIRTVTINKIYILREITAKICG